MSEPASWPAAVFDAPVLRGLDERGRSGLSRAGRLVELDAGQNLYDEGEPSDAFYVVVRGAVALEAVRRGDEQPAVVRVAKRGDTFGEDAALGGGRRARARAVEAAELAEVPFAVFQRLAEQSGASALVEREVRVLRRAATRDLLGTLALSRDLDESDLELLLDAVQPAEFRRAERIFVEGDPADDCLLVTDGLVQLSTADDGRIQVRAYLTRGDFFGDTDLVGAGRRSMTAVALGECRCLRVPGRVLRSLADRNPGLLSRLRRIAADRHALQQEVVGAAGDGSTQHVFHDLYRMQMARSLLAIDQQSCVRCGHCAWACAELYGVARLVRRGDKVVTRLDGGGDAQSLLLPNSCQHCKNPVCMIDCPTGAIGRDPRGEVFIRDELCTGCGACAKACPWENIRMAPRPDAGKLSADLAVKCDLCRDYEAPACVAACPTESIFRLEPAQDFVEVRRLLGAPGRRALERDDPRWLGMAVGAGFALSLGLGGLSLALRTAGFAIPAVATGSISGVLCLALGAYVFPKRAVRQWLRPKDSAVRVAADAARPVARSRVRPHATLHVAIGLVAMGAVALHAGLRFPSNVAGALNLGFWLAALVGVVGALLYRMLPERLSRIERRGALPEDLAREREALVARLYRDASGRSELLKAIVDKLLLPYTRRPLGSLLLVASGRSLHEEQDRLRQRVESVLEGRGGDQLDGLDDVLRTVVELRALPARRALTALLRGWLPLHLVLGGLIAVLLVLHIVGVMGR